MIAMRMQMMTKVDNQRFHADNERWLVNEGDGSNVESWWVNEHEEERNEVEAQPRYNEWQLGWCWRWRSCRNKVVSVRDDDQQLEFIASRVYYD